MNEPILIREARILDPTQNLDSPGDLLIENGKVSAIDGPGKIPSHRAQRIIEARGLLLTPGFIDLHVHLREPGLEYKESIETGTRAAVAGGFTSVACMANTLPVNDSPYITAFIRERAKAVALCRVHIVGAVTQGLRGQELAEIGGMVAEGAVAISDDGMPVMNSYLMRKAMDYARAFGIPIISHAEDTHLVAGGVVNEGVISNELGLRGNPAAAEEIMVAREIALCRLTRTPIHIQHVSTEVALEHIRRAKDAGLPVTAEASPHHLLLTEEHVRGYDTRFKMSPPLRTARDVEALRQAVADGLIDVIATDHAPHGEIDKAVEFDHASNGVIGLQTAIPATYQLVEDGIIPLRRWVESLTSGPARILNQRLGSLRVGAEADMTLLQTGHEWIFTDDHVLSKSKNSPFLNWKFNVRVAFTLVRGKVVYEHQA